MEEKTTNKPLTYEYIRGLTDGEGCFTFCSVGYSPSKKQLPTFVLAMSKQDKDLLYKIKNTLGLRNKIYEYKQSTRKDNYKRQGMCMLVIRDFGQLKNIIVPLFYKKLNGYKAKQFEEWIGRIGNDPRVPESYKFIYKIYKDGFYDRNKKYTN